MRLSRLVGLIACVMSVASSCAAIAPISETELDGFQSIQVHQRDRFWCWAACSEMVLKYGGQETTQEEIVERVKGTDEEGLLRRETASRYELYHALSPETEVAPFEQIWIGLREQLEDELDDGVEKIEAGYVPDSTSVSVSYDDSVLINTALDRIVPTYGVPIDSLLEGHPAVVGLQEGDDPTQGHLYVIIGARYSSSRIDQSIRFLGSSAGLLQNAEDAVLSRYVDKVPSEDELQRADNIGRRLGKSRHKIQTVFLIDPFKRDDEETDINEMRVELPIAEFLRRADFVTTREDAHQILTRWGQLVQADIEQEYSNQ